MTRFGSHELRLLHPKASNASVSMRIFNSRIVNACHVPASGSSMNIQSNQDYHCTSGRHLNQIPLKTSILLVQLPCTFFFSSSGPRLQTHIRSTRIMDTETIMTRVELWSILRTMDDLNSENVQGSGRCGYCCQWTISIRTPCKRDPTIKGDDTDGRRFINMAPDTFRNALILLPSR